MKGIDGQDVYTPFLERLKAAPRRVLLLDYDGTLAPFQVDPSLAFPYPEIPELLAQIAANGTRLVLISGRPARQLLLLSGIHPHPEIWGSHGLERLMPDGKYEVATLEPSHEAGLLAAVESVRHDALERRTEIKPGGVAVHWRGMTPEEVAQVRTSIFSLWTPLRTQYGLNLLNFDGGLEIRVPGHNKGDAVRTILEEEPNAAVAYVGDDTTDEDAFRAVKGRGLGVLVRPELRSTEADLWLQPPDELTQFLRDWLTAAGGRAGEHRGEDRRSENRRAEDRRGEDQ